jgi:hypothetical protein
MAGQKTLNNQNLKNIKLKRPRFISFHQINKLITLNILAGLLVGCTSTTIIDEKGRVITHNFGYVKIIKPPKYPTNRDINVTGARLIGFSIGEGFTLGYKSSEFVQIPTNCRVFVVVKDEKQLKHLINEMSLIGKEDICASISPKN